MNNRAEITSLFDAIDELTLQELEAYDAILKDLIVKKALEPVAAIYVTERLKALRGE